MILDNCYGKVTGNAAAVNRGGEVIIGEMRDGNVTAANI